MNRSFYRVGLEKELLCNPSSPSDISLYSENAIMAIIMACCSGFFSIFAIIYFINYKIILKKEKQ